jgi:hypothetical protein
MVRQFFSPTRLFLGFLGIGLLSGFFLGNLTQAVAAERAENKNLQQNTLIVFVDDLTADHQTVRGIWLAAQMADTGELSWMPIYPSPLGVNADEYSEAHTALVLENFELGDLSYLSPIHSERVWWNEAFVVDSTALIALQNLAGLNPTSTVETWLEPQRALHDQVEFLQGLCAAFPTAAGQAALDQVLTLVPAHIQSTQSPFDLITRWDDWSQSEFGLSCTHPWAN